MNQLSAVSIDQEMGGNSLEDMLVYLCRYGQPRLSRMDRGWYCALEMFVTGEGVQFEIKSEFDHKTPINAVDACIRRMRDALEKIKGVGADASGRK